MPKISVIVPVYKVETTLRRCVDSVLSQTFTDYEIILVDDGSPDSSGLICDEYDAKHISVTTIHKKNGGLSAARNTGLQYAKGEFVMFLDSDDYLSYECLEVLTGTDADMIIGMTVKLKTDGSDRYRVPCRTPEVIEKKRFSEEIPFLLETERLNFVHGKLYRRKIITENKLQFEDDMLTSAEDTVFNFTFLRYCRKLFLAEQYVHYYTYNVEGLARRYYPDRYQRAQRLNRFLAESSAALDVQSDEMKRVLDKRKILSAAYVLKDMANQQHISKKERYLFAEAIFTDDDLRDTMRTFQGVRELHPSCEGLENLMENGTRKYLSDLYQKKQKERMRRLWNCVLMYPRELLYRLHILKRKQ